MKAMARMLFFAVLVSIGYYLAGIKLTFWTILVWFTLVYALTAVLFVIEAISEARYIREQRKQGQLEFRRHAGGGHRAHR